MLGHEKIKKCLFLIKEKIVKQIGREKNIYTNSPKEKKNTYFSNQAGLKYGLWQEIAEDV